MKDSWLPACLLLAASIVSAAPSHGQSSLGPAVLPPPGAAQLSLLFPAPEALPQPGNLPAEVAPASPDDCQVAPEIKLDDESLAPTPLDEAITPTPYWYQLAYWFGPQPWEISVELGLNGSEGNNDTLSTRAGGAIKRKTDIGKFSSQIQFNRNTANSVETQNDAKVDIRIDRDLAESPWTIFFLESLIYDEFQAFDLMMSLDCGFGYHFVDTEISSLLGRLGAGATREFGGPDNEWAPQTLFGFEYEHQLTPLQRIVARVDYFPEWEDYRNYRVVSDIGWEIDLDKPKNVSLKFSLVDRYDSTPNGAVPNNLDYAALLIWAL
ncbi:DUF481 domain-containing protein [Pirellulales bacterium]|nr:DUF481 domain-containing protein [Pirellulales bacterium]